MTDKGVRSIRDAGMHNDGDGLYLRVATGGSKSWVLRTRVHGKKRDLGLGGLSWVTLAEARRKAAALRKVARDGGDPVLARDHKDLSFQEAALIVHRDQVESTARNPKHRQQWINTLQQYAFPTIGARPVGQIGQSEILRVLQPIWL